MKSATEAGFRSLSAVEGGLPKAGTKLRALYDLLYEHKGRPTFVKEIANYQLRDLRDQYGCDIQREKGTLTLVGELRGQVYYDYVAGTVSHLDEDSGGTHYYLRRLREQIAVTKHLRRLDFC